MGTIVFKAIIVSGWGQQEARRLYDIAIDLFEVTACNVTALDIGTNGVWSFAVLPDGSEEASDGWSEAKQADAARRAFMNEIDSEEFEAFDAVEVHFGHDSERHRGKAQIFAQTKGRGDVDG